MNLRAELQTLVTSRGDDLDVVSAMSYRHPNGFDKLSLDYSHLETTTRRIHLWWPDGTDPLNRDVEQVAESDVHNHPWAFTSEILTGSITNEVFAIVPGQVGGQTFEQFDIGIPESSAQGAKPYSRRVGVQVAELVSNTVLAAGDRYSLDVDVLHRIVASSDEPSSTFVHQRPLSRRNSTVLRPTTGKNRVRVRSRKFTRRQTRILLESVLDLLARTPERD